MRENKRAKPAAKRAAKRAKPAKVEVSSVELTRRQAYSLLAGVSAALEAGVEPPEDMQRSLYEAVSKFRRAFKFKANEKF
jgi:hypothetical protein